MRTSDSINEIAAALAKAQASMKNATLNKVNPHFKSKYADLAGIRDTVIPELSKHGIAVVQTIDAEHAESGVMQAIVTRLIHTSGQWIESLCPIPTVQDMQKLGSAITYARRYSLSAICGISADEDDDGNAASNGNGAKAEVKPPEGYGEWWADMHAVADEGIVALRAAWEKSKPEYRNHVAAHHNDLWNALKAKANKIRKPEPVHA